MYTKILIFEQIQLLNNSIVIECFRRSKSDIKDYKNVFRTPSYLEVYSHEFNIYMALYYTLLLTYKDLKECCQPKNGIK